MFSYLSGVVRAAHFTVKQLTAHVTTHLYQFASVCKHGVGGMERLNPINGRPKQGFEHLGVSVIIGLLRRRFASRASSRTSSHGPLRLRR